MEEWNDGKMEENPGNPVNLVILLKCRMKNRKQ
jgi:hypothetical protein